MVNSNIENLLNKDGKILIPPVGKSMWPMLKNRKDQVLVSVVTLPLKINDVVLFKRKDGKLVLHRIVKITAVGFIIRGDNCEQNEFVEKTQILGILTGFYKKDRYIDCNKNLRYKIYVTVIRCWYPFNKMLKKIRRHLAFEK